MILTDFKILGKKIVIGLVVAIVPLILITGALWATKALLGSNAAPQSLTAK